MGGKGGRMMRGNGLGTGGRGRGGKWTYRWGYVADPKEDVGVCARGAP